MFTCTVEKSVIRAVSQFMSKDDVRYYLNGVFFEFQRDAFYVVATNGHMLGAMRCEYDGGNAPPDSPLEVIVPDTLIKSVKACRKHSDLVAVSLTIDGNKVSISDGMQSVNGKAIDGKFPDWRRVTGVRDGAKSSGEVAQFDPHYVMAFSKARRELGSQYDYITITHNGNGPALVALDDTRFVGALMPVKTDKPLEAAPAWAQTKATVAAKPKRKARAAATA